MNVGRLIGKLSKMAPKVPIRMKSVEYALSPYQQDAMAGAFKKFIPRIQHELHMHGLNTILLFLTPLVGTYTYTQRYAEKEKLKHRY